MKWLARQPLYRVLIVAAIWPALIGGIAAESAWRYRDLVGGLPPHHVPAASAPFTFGDALFATVFVIGPSVFIITLWRLARHYHPPAT